MNFLSLFGRSTNASEWGAVLSAARTSIETRKTQILANISRGSIDRLFKKFGDNNLAIKYGIGVPFIHWGVLRHPDLNGGQPTSLRVNWKDDSTYVEAGLGEAWWMLTDRLWLGRNGTAPGLPKSIAMSAGESMEEEVLTAAEDVAMLLLISGLGLGKDSIELPSLRYGVVSGFAFDRNLSAEWYSSYAGMHFWIWIRGSEYIVQVRSLEPLKEDGSGVRVSAERPRQ